MLSRLLGQYDDDNGNKWQWKRDINVTIEPDSDVTIWLYFPSESSNMNLLLTWRVLIL